jgi:catechol 2,3-dioxygenase-like lactoylglutathione lyase family enzyme
MLLDHLILNINSLEESLASYTEILGFRNEGEGGPFTVVRVTPDFTLLLAPWGTQGGTHLAFSMSKAEFDQTSQRIQTTGLPYEDTFHAANNMKTECQETGAKGPARAPYLKDPNNHLIEIRHYE